MWHGNRYIVLYSYLYDDTDDGDDYECGLKYRKLIQIRLLIT